MHKCLYTVLVSLFTVSASGQSHSIVHHFFNPTGYIQNTQNTISTQYRNDVYTHWFVGLDHFENQTGFCFSNNQSIKYNLYLSRHFLLNEAAYSYCFGKRNMLFDIAAGYGYGKMKFSGSTIDKYLNASEYKTRTYEISNSVHKYFIQSSLTLLCKNKLRFTIGTRFSYLFFSNYKFHKNTFAKTNGVDFITNDYLNAENKKEFTIDPSLTLTKQHNRLSLFGQVSSCLPLTEKVHSTWFVRVVPVLSLGLGFYFSQLP